MGKKRVAWKGCWHVALQSHSACSEGEHLGCPCARRFHWLSWWGLHESQLMLCRSQFFHRISSSHGYFRKVPCNPGSLSAPCSRHCVLSPAHCQTSAEPTFPCRASSKGHQSAKLALFCSLSHLKTLLLCRLFSHGFQCLSLPGWS